MRIAQEDMRGVKKHVITDLRAHETRQLSELELQVALLEHTVSIGVIGVVCHKLCFNGTDQVIAVSSHDVHIVRHDLSLFLLLFFGEPNCTH